MNFWEESQGFQPFIYSSICSFICYFLSASNKASTRFSNFITENKVIRINLPSPSCLGAKNRKEMCFHAKLFFVQEDSPLGCLITDQKSNLTVTAVI
jgi:hypothetical protein